MTKSEFQEIGHCGGQVGFEIKTNPDGQVGISFGVTHSRPVRACFVSFYVLPPGIPVRYLPLGGIGAPMPAPPYPGCIMVFLASDSEGKFGNECQNCSNYWRSDALGSSMICPYCGMRADGALFRTAGQRKFIQAFCDLIQEKLAAGQDGKFHLNMDEVADAVGKDIEKPKFYYAEESQQNRFNCQTCDAFNDVLGRYAYCSNCGKYNGLKELQAELETIKKGMSSGGYENAVRDSVAAFDSFARQYAKQFTSLIPMMPARKNEWERLKFHNLKRCSEMLESQFGISIFKGLKESETTFICLMFHRRHLYEHNGGEVDEKYLKDSNDTSVKLKQVIRENENSASQTIELILKLGKNFDEAFHQIFPPQQKRLLGTGESRAIK